jgi:pyruvate/2-oxoglutarate dehydrogenase complex dihydrolipoamide acyltransferase (E2) component
MVTSDGADAVDVVIPHAGLAEVMVVIEWLVASGDTVDAGAPLVVVESEKTQIELEAPSAGRVEILVPASDDDVVVGAVIGRVHTSPVAS